MNHPFVSSYKRGKLFLFFSGAVLVFLWAPASQTGPVRRHFGGTDLHSQGPWGRRLLWLSMMYGIETTALSIFLQAQPAFGSNGSGSSSQSVGHSASGLLEHLWESLQQQLRQTATDDDESTQERSSDTASKASKARHHRRTNVVVGRRRKLFEYAMHQQYQHWRQHLLTQHYENQSQTPSRSNTLHSTTSDNIEHSPASQQEQDVARHLMRSVMSLEHVHHAYLYESSVDENAKIHPDRTTSLHASLPPMPPSRTKANRDLVKAMFIHAYDAYMYHGWPQAEVRPLTCQPGTFDLIKLPGLTLLDSLDMLLIVGNATEFARSVERLRQLHAKQPLLAVDQNVSVFETNIRVLGGLLSAHQLALAFLEHNQSKATKPPRFRVPLSHVFDSQGHVKWGPSLENGESSLPENESENAMCQSPRDDWMAHSASSPSSKPWLSNCALSALAVQDCSTLRALDMSPNNTTAMAGLVRGRSQEHWVYDGFFLELAEDLGNRMLPAFATKTGIPFGTINLLYGVPSGETPIASLAGGGTLSLEFELLSRLTGDKRFGKAAKLASRALWMRQSNLHLFGKHIDIQRGSWTETLSGIGSNSDSFLEYLAKQYFLFPEDEDFWYMLMIAYAGVHDDSRVGEWYVDVDMNSGLQGGNSRRILESLMAFYPGMQILLGELTAGARSLNSMFMVREMLGFLPERFNYAMWQVDGGVGGGGKHPLRPELLESCYFLHRAAQGLNFGHRKPTEPAAPKSSGWLWAADFAVHKLESATRTRCGYAGLHHVDGATTGLIGGERDGSQRLMNEMPSFFLSETLKYLYLTFDDSNILHQDDERQWIFTTEAHPLHNVPMKKKPTKVKDSFLVEKQKLKSMLSARLMGRKPQAGIYPPDLTQEKWSELTHHDDNRHILLNIIANDVYPKVHARKSAPTKSFFFNHRDLVDVHFSRGHSISMDTFNETLNGEILSHLSLSNLGVGSGYNLRKSCPNFYSSELIWLHALNGGSSDYSDVYVSVMNDDTSTHPNQFGAFGASDALGFLGSGTYHGDLLFDGEQCLILEEKKEGSHQNDETQKEEEPSLEPFKTTQRVKSTPAGDVIEVKSDLGTFDVMSDPDGGAFFIQESVTGEKVLATFMTDIPSAGPYVMAYSTHYDQTSQPDAAVAVPVVEEEIEDGGDENVTPDEEQTTSEALPVRRLIVADLQGNSFSCEVQVVQKFLSDVEEENEDEQILLSIPCSPALFGPTHPSRLLVEKDDAIIEAPLISPPDFDLMGCLSQGICSVAPASFVPDSERNQCALGGSNTAIHMVHRGDCPFVSKVINAKTSHDARAVIVLNTEDEQLFGMSHGAEDGDDLAIHGDDEMPAAVMITKRDGDLVLSILNETTEEGSYLVGRIKLIREYSSSTVQTKKAEDTSRQGARPFFPIVHGSGNTLSIYAQGGWGIAAVNAREDASSSDWKLNLLRHTITPVRN